MGVMSGDSQVLTLRPGPEASCLFHHVLPRPPTPRRIGNYTFTLGHWVGSRSLGSVCRANRIDESMLRKQIGHTESDRSVRGLENVLGSLPGEAVVVGLSSYS